MESLIQSCNSFEQYPQNILRHDALSHTLKAFSNRLESQANRLFNERQAAIDLLNINCRDGEYSPSCVTTLYELKEVLREALKPEGSDPQCRFLHAPHGRASLRVSRDMLCFLFTYHQVMPSFLDFVFPFGKQINAQDFHFSGLREESRLDVRRRGPEILELNRSGNELRLCYNLRSVEPSSNQTDLRWSIRQTAIYHSFDLKTGQTLWINVKGNKLIKNRITEATTSPSLRKPISLSEAFTASLATHLLLCDWSGENWRWYINDLEDQFHLLTNDALAIPIDKPPSPIPSPTPLAMSPRIQTGNFTNVPQSATAQSPRSARTKWGFSSTVPSRTTTLVDLSPTTDPSDAANGNCHDQEKWYIAGSMDSNKIKRRLSSFYSRTKKLASGSFWRMGSLEQQSSCSSEKGQVAPSVPGNRLQPPELPPTFSEDGYEKPQESFTFSDLQRLQYIEDRAQEALLVLRLNTEVLGELRQHYQYAAGHAEFPAELHSQCDTDLARFEKCVLSVEKDLRMLQSRTDTLLCLLANRKNLLNGILQYRGVKASEFFAKKAQVSAIHMENMTLEMHAIAKKTEQETVSMRVITTVTLFFLPATFIATFMSTDILRFQDGNQKFQIRALHTYLMIALPLTAITFLAWWIFFYIAKKGYLTTNRSSGVSNQSNSDVV